MGMSFVEQQQSQQQQQQSGGDQKKKQRRSARRSKSYCTPFNGSATIELAGQHQQIAHSPQISILSRNGNLTGQQQQTPQSSQICILSRNSLSSKQHCQNRTANVDLNSLPLMHVNESGAPVDPCVEVVARSCLPSTMSVGKDGQVAQGFSPPYSMNGCSNQKRFDPHWSSDAVEEALKRGDIFQAQLRVNAFNRLEAYCTIEGVPTDILISGIPSQNRAVEGDVVAVKVDPPQLWSKMKGSVGSGSNPSPTEDKSLSDDTGITYDSSKGKNSEDPKFGSRAVTNFSPVHDNGFPVMNGSSSDMVLYQDAAGGVNFEQGGNEALNSVERLLQVVVSFPFKRPTGTVVAIIEPSASRRSVVGFLNTEWCLNSKEGLRNANLPSFGCDYIHLTPTDPKHPKMVVPMSSLPTDIKKRLDKGDASIDTEIVAAYIDGWSEDSLFPRACVVHNFGRGCQSESWIAAILFENAIISSGFSAEALSCLPNDSWQVPEIEVSRRRDIRNACVFTIDPSTASDLDDALSVERLSNGVYRVGVHIADVSYFVRPDTVLDTEAQARSTSVYMLKRKIPMLPALLSENLGSLVPGVDRLTFSIFWDMDISGNVLDRWVGRTVIRSCCKLSYEHAQAMIDGRINVDSLDASGNDLPQLYGHFGWHDVFQSVKMLHRMSIYLKARRFRNGALRLDNAKIVFLLDEFGDPYDCKLSERKDSNFLVEEFMLLANITAAEIIYRAFPHSALLRKHPEPNKRKLKEFEGFCLKHGLELDASMSGSLYKSLEKIREKLKDDSVLYDILINCATKPMQLAKYFCTGDISVDENDWGHYALAVPLYTHFTSPLRRYPDVVVHRTLTAAIEAEKEFFNMRLLQKYSKQQNILDKVSIPGDLRCFTGLSFIEPASKSAEAMQVLSSTALKHGLLQTEALSELASYCNMKKLATRHVKDAIDKLYMWVLLKKKEIFLSDARVLAVGPRFMSIYIQKLAIERRIHYDDVDGLIVEWLEATSTLVLNYVHRKRSHRRSNTGRHKSLEEVALMDNPCQSESDRDTMLDGLSLESSVLLNSVKSSGQSGTTIDPAVFPLTIRAMSKIPVALHAVGGDDGPLDVGARLYVTSYFR